MSVEAAKTSVKAYQVKHLSTKHGDFDYDDNGGYWQSGVDEWTVPGVFMDRFSAEQVCALRNATVYADMVEAYDEGGPFEEVEDETGEMACFEKWETRVALPWPMFCDWLKDHNIPRPIVDRYGDDEFENQDEPVDAETCLESINGPPPAWYLMRDWWEHVVYSSAHRVARIELLKQVIPGPKLYVVDEVQLDREEAAAIVASVGGPEFKSAAETVALFCAEHGNEQLKAAAEIVLNTLKAGAYG